MKNVFTEKAENRVDINEIILNDDLYSSTKKELYDDLIEDLSTRRHEAILVIQGEEMVIRKASFLTNLVVNGVYNKFKREITPDMIIGPHIDGGVIKSHFDKIINIFEDEDVDEVNLSMAKAIEEMDKISGEVNIRIGTTISLFGLIDLAEKNEEFGDIIRTKVKEKKMQFKEMEDYISSQKKRMIEILSSTDNVLTPYIKSKTGINVDQLGQAIVNIGLKPDLEGKVIPEPIDTNFIMGFNNVRDFYINAIGARKALITNFAKVRDSGYLTRKLSLESIDTMIDYEMEDCGTTHYIQAKIPDKETLERLNGRWYLESEDEMEMIEDSRTDLIGQIVSLRSPVLCNHPEGKVCRTCYGDLLAKVNKDKHIGILATLILTNQLTQRLLSAKHLLKTQSSVIEWSEDFMNYFSVDRNMVLSNVNDNSHLVIYSDDFIENETNDMKTKNFSIVSGSNEKAITSPVTLYLSDFTKDIIDEYKVDDHYKIPMKEYNGEDVVFYYEMENNELSASLQKILDLIDTTEHIVDDVAYSELNDFYNVFIHLLNESKITINSVHIELIMKELVRSVEDETQYPDLNSMEVPPYRILRVTESILKSKAVSKSLAFQNVKQQLEDPRTYKKTAKSLVDKLI
jgi:hypothetical protein